ncbi:hypothetical protein BJQ97_00838 [Geobacillus sp. TFV-3]|nr:hypothetical protein BJQ97_00838 [Geobacillus sp. TFV-3]
MKAKTMATAKVMSGFKSRESGEVSCREEQ